MTKRFDEETEQLIKNNKDKIITKEDVLSYLELEEEFLSFIKDKMLVIDHYEIEDPYYFYGVFPKYNNGIITSFRLVIPKVVDLKTALITVHELKHAHDLFKILGKKLEKEIDEYEIDAREEEKKFVKYIDRKGE